MEKLKEKFRKDAVEFIQGIRLVSVIYEMEHPGCGELVFDVIIEEINKCRKKHTPEMVNRGEKTTGDEACEGQWGANMNFGDALVALKQGKRVARSGWNGKNMSVAYQKGYPEGIPCNKNTAEAWGMQEGELFKCRPYLQMRCADGTFQMWLASQSDILADDWYIVE